MQNSFFSQEIGAHTRSRFLNIYNPNSEKLFTEAPTTKNYDPQSQNISQALQILQATPLRSCPEIATLLQYYASTAPQIAEKLLQTHKKLPQLLLSPHWKNGTPEQKISILDKACLLEELHLSHLTRDNIAAFIASGQYAEVFITALEEIYRFNLDLISSPLLKILLAAKSHARELAMALKIMYHINSALPPEHECALLIAAGKNAEIVAKIFKIFAKSGMDSQLLIKHLSNSLTHSSELLLLLKIVSKIAGNHRNHHQVCNNLLTCWDERLVSFDALGFFDPGSPLAFTPYELEQLLRHTAPIELVQAVTEIKQHYQGLLTKENINALLLSEHPFNTWEELRLKDEQQGIRLGQHRARLPVDRPNVTHTKSIHKSSSESALRLQQRYGQLIRTHKEQQNLLSQIKQWAQAPCFNTPLNTYSQKTHSDALIDALQRTVDSTLVDPDSGISLPLFLLLCWSAINDRQQVKNHTAALEHFASGLIDIVSYNQQGLLSTICSGGIFNKLNESLVGSHDDAVQILHDTGYAAAKTIVYIKEAVLEHLNSLTSIDEVKELSENGLPHLWESLTSTVISRLDEDFGPLFQGDRARMRDFINEAKDLSWKSLKLEGSINASIQKLGEINAVPVQMCVVQPEVLRSYDAIVFSMDTTPTSRQQRLSCPQEALDSQEPTTALYSPPLNNNEDAPYLGKMTL